ncbi:DUF982 domain-containing protein [Rhizobium cremeum]|uniref:DUF982 domain-containing protein n=1 Tax=Rhizobium cremeum TaxID=2813827 RepID=UPI000DDEFC11|nr:DUF982 domain-containing protein [Rhizobium cremeum]MCJ7993736.1 DUF982 domain-containing protein [Rhizobium cremeum]MCJ7998793.1 DUF982 domain-containing protein [Rhizobium cremeum]
MIHTTPTWNEPVELKLQCGLTRSFKEAYDALYFLEEEWPVRHGAAYQRAKRWCGMALETDRASDIARKAFVEAARKAGLLDKGSTPDSANDPE